MEKKKHITQYRRGTLYSKSDLTDLLNKIKSFYELENIEEMVNQENKLSYLEMKMENYAANYSRMVHRNENGLYEVPEPDFKYKPFKPEKGIGLVNVIDAVKKFQVKNTKDITLDITL